MNDSGGEPRRRAVAADERLRKVERLLHAPQYLRVFRRGRCFRDASARIHVVEGAASLSRLGLVVSRKVGNAVVRNRVKRRLREVFRRSKSRLPRIVDLVVVSDPRYGPASFDEYEAMFERFLDWLQKQSRLTGRRERRRRT